MKKAEVKIPQIRMKKCFYLIIGMILILFALFFYLPSQKVTVKFDEEFQLHNGQEAEVENIKIKLDKTVVPICEDFVGCKGIGAAVSVGSGGKAVESFVMEGAEKEFFIIDKRIGINITEAGQNFAKLVVLLK